MSSRYLFWFMIFIGLLILKAIDSLNYKLLELRARQESLVYAHCQGHHFEIIVSFR